MIQWHIEIAQWAFLVKLQWSFEIQVKCWMLDTNWHIWSKKKDVEQIHSSLNVICYILEFLSLLCSHLNELLFVFILKEHRHPWEMDPTSDHFLTLSLNKLWLWFYSFVLAADVKLLYTSKTTCWPKVSVCGQRTWPPSTSDHIFTSVLIL